MTKWLYCPECKAELDGSGEFAKCPKGHFVKYNTPVISAFGFFEFDGKYLFMKRDYWPRKGFWSVPAGFLENNETAEEGLAREAKEEANIDIDISKLEYIGSFYQEYGDKYGTKNVGIGYKYRFDALPKIELNDEHSDYLWATLDDAPEIASTDVRDALEYLQNKLSKMV